MPFCENCGGSIEPGSKFCDNCGVPLDDQTLPPQVMPPPTSQRPLVADPVPPGAAPMTGIANKFVGGYPLYTIIGVCGVVLIILSFIIPCIGTYYYDPLMGEILNYLTHPYYYSFTDAIGFLTAIIGVVGGIIGLLRHSWKAQVISGLIFLISPLIFISYYRNTFEPFWFVVAFLGSFLLVIAGLLMRTATSSIART